MSEETQLEYVHLASSVNFYQCLLHKKFPYALTKKQHYNLICIQYTLSSHAWPSGCIGRVRARAKVSCIQ